METMRSFTLNFVCLNSLEDSFTSTLKETETEYKSMGNLLENYKDNRESFHFMKINDINKEETISYYLSLFPIYFYKNIKITFKHSNGKLDNKVVTLSDQKLGDIQGLKYKYILDGKILNKNLSLVDLNIKRDTVIEIIDEIKIFDASIDQNGQCKKLKIPEDEFVIDFKRRLNLNEDSYIKVNGKALYDDNVLISNHLDGKTTNVLKIVDTQKKGTEVLFVDVSEDKTKDLQFSNSAPEWRICTNGINILGNCTNENCEAFKEQVIFMYGFGLFDLVHDLEKVECPMCKEYFEPETVGYTNCNYYWSGIKMENRKPKKYPPSEKIRVENCFRYFLPDENGKVKWKQLKLMAEEISQSDELKCELCKKELGKFYSEESCHHKYHKECLEKFNKIIKSCVVCQL
jgi:hypothetical protein